MAKISIIIPTVNSPWIDQVLVSLSQQTYSLAGVEVLVIGLDEPGRLQAFERVKFIDTKQKIRPARVRNLGIQQASGDILCFLDDDCIPEPDWLARLLEPYASSVDIVGGSMTFPRDSYWTLCDSLANFADILVEVPSGWRDYLPSLNFSARRTVFDAVGLFDEEFPFPAGEDTELTQRMRQAGYRLWFAADALVYHAAYRQSGLVNWRRAWQFGQSVAVNPALCELLHPSSFFQHWLVMFISAWPRALIATGKIFQQYPSLLKYWRSIPGVTMSKFAWQLGAATALQQSYSRRKNR